MTPEIIALVSLLKTSWPGADWTDEMLRLWGGEFAKRDIEGCHTAIQALRESSKFRPSHVEFVGAYQAAMRRKMEQTAAPALPPGSGTPHGPMFAALRAVFSVERPPHNHRHGAEGCACCKLHDLEAHKRDRSGFGPAQCPRCKELADVFFEAADIG